jgi:GntR family transcriptional regulator
VDLAREPQARRGETEFRASSPVPSAQVEQILRQRLRRECEPGSPFSSEIELCEEFRVSRTLIRPILARLVEEGLLERKARLRTIVARPRKAPGSPQLLDLIDRLQAYRPNTSVEVLDIAVGAAEPALRERFRVDADAPISVIRRLVTLDGTPVSYMMSFLPHALGRRVTQTSLERQPLAWILTRRLGITIRKAMQTVEPVVADLDAARYLDVAAGAPLLLVERDFLGRDDKVVFHTRQFFRGDRYKFSTTLQWKRSSRRSRGRAKG